MNACVEFIEAETVMRCLRVLREVDLNTHDILDNALPYLAERLHSETEIVALVDLLNQIAREVPEAAQALAHRLGSEVDLTGDSICLRKWALEGLQRYRFDIKRMVRYFEWDDPRTRADFANQNDADYLLDQRFKLLHYLAGFGFINYGLVLHEPKQDGLPEQSPSVADELIHMPRHFQGVEPDQRQFLYRACLAHVAAHLRHSPLGRNSGNRRPALLAITGLIEDARVERLMMSDFPGLQKLWGRFHNASRKASGSDFTGLAARLARALHDPSYEDTNFWVIKGRNLFEGAAGHDLDDVATFDRIARELSIDLATMRLALPRHFRPAPIYRDDNAVLWHQSDVFSEREDKVVRPQEFELRPPSDLAKSTYSGEVDLRRRFRYPEWDKLLEVLHRDWATVIEEHEAERSRTPQTSSVRWARERTAGLQWMPDRNLRRTRLYEGDDLDLNAVVDCAVQRRAGVEPDGRIFCRHGRRRRSVAVILLLDLSASTDRFAPGTFTTVLELEKRVAMMFSDALDARVDRVAIHGFASNGRHEVNYWRVKEFDEPFDGRQQARLDALASGLSTRMGAALRHATVALDQQVADQKVILVLTDGVPSDIDVMDDDYLVEDARHATLSASGRGVRAFCVTLDRRADSYVQRIFGARNYLVAERASAFESHVARALVHMVAN